MSEETAKPPFLRRLLHALRTGFVDGLKAVFTIACVMIPVSLAVLFLNRWGFLTLFSDIMNPFMSLIGLSGKASLVFISSILFNIYGAIAVMDVLPLGMREITILAVMCLIAHNLVIETAIMKKTKSSAIKMVVMRLFSALAAAWVLNFILPSGGFSPSVAALGADQPVIKDLLGTWFLATATLLIKFSILVLLIKIAQKIMEELNIIIYLSKVLAPFMRIFGLARENADLWVVMNLISYARCATMVTERVKGGKMKPQEADLLNHHASMMHSLLKDTLPFMLIGAPLFWLVLPRAVMALGVVWIERVRRTMFKRSFRIGTK